MPEDVNVDRRHVIALLGAATLGGCTSFPARHTSSPTTDATASPSPTDAASTPPDSDTPTGTDTEPDTTTPTTRTLTIGVLAPTSTFSWAGRGMVRGARIAAERSATETVTPEVVVADTEGSPGAARDAYRRLQREENPDVTVGGYVTQSILQWFDPMAAAATVHVTTGAYGTKLAAVTRRDYETYKYHFRAGPLNDTDQGRAATRFLRRLAAKHDIEPVGVMIENTERFDGMAAELARELGNEVEVSTVKRTSTGTTDWGPTFDDFASADTRLLFAGLHYTNGAIRQWDDGDWQFALGGLIRPLQSPRAPEERDPNRTPTPVKQPDDVEHVFTAAPYASRGTRRWASFAATYRDRYGAIPPYTAATTHDAVLAVTEVAAGLASWDGDRFVEALERYETTDSVSLPRLAFRGRDATHVHDPVWAPNGGSGGPVVVQWQDGEQIPIYPASVADGSYRSSH